MMRAIALRISFRLGLLTTVLAVGTPNAVAAQAPSAADGPWSGHAQCVITTRGTNYEDEQTHTWRMTGGPPRRGGSVRHWPGVWSVQGKGSRFVSSANPGSATLTTATGGPSESWTISVPETPAEIAIYEIPGFRGKNSLRIEAQHLLVASGAISASASSGQRFSASLQEWAFPKINADVAETTVTGTRSQNLVVGPGWQRPFTGALTTETCTWSFSKGTQLATPLLTIPLANPPASSPSPAANAPLSKSPTTATSGLSTGGGGLTAAPKTATGVTAETAVDPSNFTAVQTADGTVRLTWSAVPGAGSYMVGGPGTNVGVTVNGLSHTVTGLQPGAHTWTVATMYNPGGILTTADKWSKATATVVNQSGRYRIVINGFRANNETYDDQLNFDGQHDEVYASAAVTTLDRRNDSTLQPRSVIKSATYGDSNQSSRIRAGSATALGGIANGDVVPDGSNPQTATGIASGSDRFPFKLWEGVLRDGIEAVVVNPVLWEADGGQEHYVNWSSDTWFTRLQPTRVIAQGAAIKDRAMKADLNPFRGIYLFPCDRGVNSVSTLCANGHDRPIGMNRDACIDGAGDTLVVWCELTMVFTREAIETLLTSPYQTGGLAPGVISVRLVEPIGINGNYDMFIRVERVP